MLNSFLTFFENIKENSKLLFPIIIGFLIGVLVFSNLLNYLFYEYPIQTKSIFIGLIIGTIPNLLGNLNKRKKINKKHILLFFISLFISLISIYIENRIVPPNLNTFSFMYLFISGFLMSIGVIIPGVSSTVILMLLKVYPYYLDSISKLYIPFLYPMGLGLLFGSIIFMKITKFLLDNFYTYTFITIIGFTISSVFILIPSYSSFLELIISLLCIIVGYMISSLFKEKV